MMASGEIRLSSAISGNHEGKKFSSRYRFIATVAFMWATPMSIFFAGWLHWRFDALSIQAAFAIICICAAAGWGVGALVYKLAKCTMKSGGKQH